ncbi:MAG: adenylyl-sulfate kinase, partial [Clostridiales bacterium]|nr:adenylyl-sulfate kinase [Clostridiales bacterium]
MNAAGIQNLRSGDMPGDKIAINEGHVLKADKIYPKLTGLLNPVLSERPSGRAVVSICGGSGVGKSEIASLLGHKLDYDGIGNYILSGDNYPHRIPAQNDAERLRIFRHGGIRGLITNGLISEERSQTLMQLQESGEDANPAMASEHPWLAAYQKAGRGGLKGYLGTPNEINFAELSGIISRFKNSADRIYLKRMGRGEADLWYDAVDFRNVKVLIIEWTHGNSDFFEGVDIPVLLNSTPAETLEHRKSRGRDGGAD